MFRVSVPAYHKIHPMDGGDFKRRLVDIERRLERLDTVDPLALLDQRFGTLTLREMVADAAHLDRMQSTMAKLESRFGDPAWLRWGQPIMLGEGGPKSEFRERSKQWIMLANVRYPRGGEGPIPLPTSTLLYSHAHGGVLAAIDEKNPDNPAQIKWAILIERPGELGSHGDCPSIVDGVVNFQLRCCHGPKLEVSSKGKLSVKGIRLAVVSIEERLQGHVKAVKKQLAESGRGTLFAPTLDTTVRPE